MHSRLQSVPPAPGPADRRGGTTDLVALLLAEHGGIRQLFDIYEDLLANGAGPPLRH